MTREQFIAEYTKALEKLFSFTDGEDERRRHFEVLALDTYDFLADHGVHPYRWFSPSLQNTGNFLRQTDRNIAMPPSLLRRWQDWEEEYGALVARNPRLELRNMMQNISESYDASSWPYGNEGRIQDWVDAGDAAADPPFDDRYRIVTWEFYERLCELRRRCGGWLYWDDKLQRVVFAREPEWQQIRAAQESARAERRKAWDDAMARSGRLARRLVDVMTAARSDGAFWEALKSWELAREAGRPATAPKLGLQVLSGALALAETLAERSQRIVEAFPEWRNQIDNPPVDAIFADFIARVRVSDDAATVGEIVLRLRAAVREELGLDGVIVWRGGPGIGQLSS